MYNIAAYMCMYLYMCTYLYAHPLARFNIHGMDMGNTKIACNEDHSLLNSMGINCKG